MRALQSAVVAGVICAVACSVTHTVNASIEVTRGATTEAKQAVGDAREGTGEVEYDVTHYGPMFSLTLHWNQK
jgi:hypothetical protein